MRIRSHVHRGIGCAAAAAIAISCGTAQEEGQRDAAQDTVAVPDSVYVSEERETLPPERIYHVLTDHEWYARGEALVHEGAPYSPDGAPVAASLPQMQLVGEYGGVEYYVAEQQPGVLYVPVYEGYWQPFRAESGTQIGE